MTDDDFDWGPFEKMVKRMRAQIEKGEGYDVDQLLTRAWVDMGRVIPDFSAAAQGLLDHQRGIPAARYDSFRSGGFQLDDGLDIDDPDGPAVLPPPDEAVAARKELFRSAMDAVRAISRMRDLVIINARLGLPRDDPRRAPTRAESNRAEAETQPLDDVMCCASCLRIGHEAPRYRGKLCRWEYELAQTYRGKWPQIDEKLTPVDLLREHIEAEQGRIRLSAERVERSLRVSFGTPRKVAS